LPLMYQAATEKRGLNYALVNCCLVFARYELGEGERGEGREGGRVEEEQQNRNGHEFCSCRLLSLLRYIHRERRGEGERREEERRGEEKRGEEKRREETKRNPALSSLLIPQTHSSHYRQGNAPQAVHLISQATRDGLRNDLSWYTNVSSAHACDGKHAQALATLDTLSAMGGSIYVLSLPTLILNLATVPEGRAFCLKELKRLLRAAVLVPQAAYSALIKRMGDAGDLEGCVEVMNELKKNGINVDVVTYRTLVEAYAKSGRVLDALAVLEEMRRNKIIPLESMFAKVMVALSGKSDSLKLCLEVMKQMEETGVKASAVIYNNLLNYLSETQQMELCERYFKQMQDEGIKPNNSSYVSMISGHGQAGNLERCVELKNEMEKRYIPLGGTTFNALIVAYGKKGKMDECNAFFEKLKQGKYKPTERALNVLLDGNERIGNTEMCKEVSTLMFENGYTPTNEKFKAIARERVPWHIL
jgi:leucine-rich PPR motif-containing protein, mitochondrial